MLVMPPSPLLPGKLGALTLAQTSAGVATDATAQEFAADGCLPLPMNPPPLAVGTAITCAAILKEDGLSRFSSGTYTRTTGGAPLGVVAFEFGDATGAYSAYTFYRTLLKAPRIAAGDARVGKAKETTTDGDVTLSWAGVAVVRITGKPSAAEGLAIVSAMPKVGGSKGQPPLLPTYLPADGLAPASARYALGPIGYQAMNGALPANLLGWEKSAEALTAAYDRDGSMTLLLYPTPQIAGDRGRAVEAFLNQPESRSRFGTVKMRRVGPLVGMAMGGLTAEKAQALVASLHLTQDLSFDKPMPLEFHAEIKKTATLLQSIAIFCGVTILAAVVLGIFFGGARAGIRVLQGKPAASEPEFLSINLRDKPKGLFAGGDGKES